MLSIQLAEPIVERVVLVGDDNNLYRSFAAGDQAALKEIYSEYGALVLGLSRRLVGSEAEDLAQMVFVSAWKSRKSFDPDKGSMKTWLCSITRNRATDMLRKRGRSPQIDGSRAGEAEALPDSYSADDVVDSVILVEALQTLPAERRQLIELGYFKGLTHEQIAQQTNIPLGTVKSHIRRGLEQLSRELGGSYE